MTGHSDEKELLKCIAGGDRKAFTSFYINHLKDLYHYIYLYTKSKESTEEIIQNLFVKMWERKEILEHITSVKAYLYRVAKNLLLDEIRKNHIEAKILITLKPSSEESLEKSDSPIIYKQYYLIFQDAINLLPEKRKQIVELRTKDDLSLDEIAQKLSISKSVVKKQLYTGMDFIRRYIQKHAELTAS